MNIKRVYDLKKEEQTDELKYELYKMILPFVQKYQPQYYPQYDGSLEDLASQFYLDFMTEVGRDEDNQQNLLDKFDPSVTTLPYLVKISVQRALIDEARKDKGEVSYDKGWNDEDSENSNTLLDFFTSQLPEDHNEQLEEREFDDDFIAAMKDKFASLSPKEKKDFEDYYNEVKNVLSPNFKDLFSFLEKDFESNKYGDYVLKLNGSAPNFSVSVESGPEDLEVSDIRARHKESAVQKLQKMYPGAVVVSDSKIVDSCKKLFSANFLKKINA